MLTVNIFLNFQHSSNNQHAVHFKNNKTCMYGAYKVTPELSILMNSLEYSIASLTIEIFNIHC